MKTMEVAFKLLDTREEVKDFINDNNYEVITINHDSNGHPRHVVWYYRKVHGPAT